MSNATLARLSGWLALCVARITYRQEVYRQKRRHSARRVLKKCSSKSTLAHSTLLTLSRIHQAMQPLSVSLCNRCLSPSPSLAMQLLPQLHSVVRERHTFSSHSLHILYTLYTTSTHSLARARRSLVIDELTQILMQPAISTNKAMPSHLGPRRRAR